MSKSAAQLKAPKHGDNYDTPEWVYKPLGAFDLDPCAGQRSCIAATNWRDLGGLTRDWFGRVWCNPPYSKDGKPKFLAKLWRHGCGTALMPASTDAKWFRRAIERASAVLYLAGRVNFPREDGKESSNGGGSVLIAFGEVDRKALRAAWESDLLKGTYAEVVHARKPYLNLFSPLNTSP